MGKLKPIGSEKLQGIEKIQRIMEIARYKENTPNPINEVNSNHYNVKLADGNTYHIEKEKNGYVIKRSINEGLVDYLEPMKNRKFYQSYSQAFKRLNLVAKEINERFEHDNHISLFNEDKKFVLKTPKPEPSAEPMDSAPMSPPSMDTPSPEMPPTSDEVSDMPPPDGESDMPPAPDDEMDTDDMPPAPDEMDNDDMPESDDEEGAVSFKTIQKLTGKLSQKLRKLNQGEEPISADDTKYVLNSILSALDLSVLTDEDMEDIISRLEDSEIESDDEMPDDEMPDNEDAPPPPPTDDELPESYDFELGEEETNEYIEGMIGGEYDLGFSDTPKKITKFRSKLESNMGDMMEDNEYEGVSKIFDSVFSESKVDNIIKSYFVETDKEKKYLQEQKQKKFLSEKAKKIKIMREVETLSESYRQESTSSKFLDRYNKANFVGKTNKKNLVFEVNGKQYKITPDGAIL